MMTINKLRTLTVIILGLSGGVFAQQKTWTLQECVDYALENNITVQKGSNTLLINEEDITAAKGSLLPSLGASARQGLSLGNQELFPGQFVDRTANSTNIGINVNQTIFNGFRNTNLHKQAQLTLDRNQLELNRIKDDISLNVVNAYLNILFNKENLETAQAQLEFSTKQLEQVKALVDAGVQAQANTYDAEATVSSDEQNLTVAENNYNLAILSLSQLLQLPYEGFNVEIIEVDSPSAALMYEDIGPILEYAYNNRYEIKVAEKNIEGAELNTEISKGGYLPNVSFSYGFGSNVFYTNLQDDEATFMNQLNDNKAHSFSLNIGIPIFSQFQNKTAVAKAKIQKENSKLDLEQAKLDLESNIQRAFTDAQAALKAYEASKKSVAAQKLSFENAQERYTLGSMNTFDLEQSRIQLINAQSRLINAKYDFVFKTKVLDFYLGKPITQ
ncbi:outer membrane protein [Bizionia echini]|uniref:Outer membrane protein n=1 Tax=Bizionia echini TaxID=649333 RepID=A0A1I4ZU59_9FLAO|nr:TolC family protein [Bizionia echini]SFN53540.1 outer membrane protein [Bizionia echini]